MHYRSRPREALVRLLSNADAVDRLSHASGGGGKRVVHAADVFQLHPDGGSEWRHRAAEHQQESDDALDPACGGASYQQL